MPTDNEVLQAASEHVKFWKSYLRLEDWDIQLRLDNDLDGAACVSTAPKIGVARIKIVNPEHRKNRDPYGITDIELSVVHEMLHIRFDSIDPKSGSAQDIRYEIGIERVAQCLVMLRHQEDNVWLSKGEYL